MHEHTVDLSTPCGPVTADFGKGRLTGGDVVTVRPRPGFGIGHREYRGQVLLVSPGWTESAVAPLSDTSLAGADGKFPLPRERAAMVAAMRAAVAAYAARAEVAT